MNSEKRINIQFAVVILILMAAMGVMQNRIDTLNQNESFYRWLLAFETRTHLSDTGVVASSSEEKQLFDNVKTVGSELASIRWSGVNDIFAESVTPSQQWDIACSKPLAAYRHKFAELLRSGKLQSAKGVINWQQQGVGQHLGSLILGFRTAVADLIWLKVDTYWHAGDRYRMLSAMYTVVELDPHFLDAYAIGAWHMAYNIVDAVKSPEEKKEYTDRAIAFLKDGLSKNPHHWKLYCELGHTIYFIRLKDYANAVKYLELAYQYNPPIWYQRALFLAYEKNGQYEKSLKGWEGYAKEHPENKIAPRMILELKAIIATQNGDEDKAMSIWRQIYDDPRFKSVRSRADIAITKYQAKKAEQNGRDMDALRLWRSLIVKRYPEALDESLDNIRRLRAKLGMPPLKKGGTLDFWEVLENAKKDKQVE